MNKIELERLMQVSQDTKKEYSYSKSEGTWSWYNCNDSYDDWHHGFSTFREALEDSVSPYFELINE
jgi:hypothetical protein